MAILLKLVCLLWLSWLRTTAGGWSGGGGRGVQLDYLKQHADEVQTFLGNQTHSDHFKLLRQDGETLLIGARNIVYNISLATLEENQESRITWESRERDTELCLVKGKSEDDCQNYIRVLATVDSNQLLVCGTNSYNPRCRNYARSNDTFNGFEVVHEFSGKGYCPYDPRHNSTSIFTDGELYSGTVSDFSGSDALIIKDQIRTEQYNLKHLNGPDFVNSIEDEDFVYFFFREEAVEYMNCGKSIYSRVGRVCKNDKGGPHTFRNKWTTYLKARLNCSVPGSYPFYFNEVQAVTHQVMSNPEDGPIVYAVFNTPENSITGSAVCSFKMSDIRASFDGEFKAQGDVNSNWLPLAKHEVPETRPGSCHNDSRSLDEEHLNFLKENILMDKAVPPSINMPHFIKTSPHERLTTIAVDSNVPTSSGEKVDILFVGTTRGRVLKLANLQGGRTHLVEEMQMFPLHVAVNNILVVRDIGRLIVLSDHEVKSVPVSRCQGSALQSCGACVALQDPYCAWNLAKQMCMVHTSSKQDSSSLIQNVEHGVHAGCGVDSRPYLVSPKHFAEPHVSGSEMSKQQLNEVEEVPYMMTLEDFYPSELPRLAPVERSLDKNNYSEKTLCFAIAISAVIAVLVGFLVGFLFSRRCQQKGSNLRCGHAYLEAQMLERSKKDPSSLYESAYTNCNSPGGLSTTKNNLLSNQPIKSDTLKNNLTVNNSASGGTLGKCKKVYI